MIRSQRRIATKRHDPPCVYFADPVALERVLANLLENAACHGGDAPIDVNLYYTEQPVSLEICDRGSGLGLAIARQLAVKRRRTIELLPCKSGGTVAKLGLPPAQRRCSHDANGDVAA